MGTIIMSNNLQEELWKLQSMWISYFIILFIFHENSPICSEFYWNVGEVRIL